MTIKFWCSNREYVVERDLSKESIITWRISDELGYAERGGSLIINFKRKDGLEGIDGIYPPIYQIINLDEVLEYLKLNESKNRLLKFTKPKLNAKRTKRIG